MTKATIKKMLRGKHLTYDNAKNILHRLGYAVVLFNTSEGDVEIERYNLLIEKTVLKAFTYYETARIVFVDNNLHPEDKLHLLLHESWDTLLWDILKEIIFRTKANIF